MFVVSAVGLIVGAAVSERQSLATHLLEQTTYLNSLIQNSPLGIMVLNPNGTVELANDAFKKLFLYEETDLAARSIHSIFPAAENQNTAELPEIILSDKTIQKSIRRRRKDGKLLDLELHTVPVITNGNAQGAYTIYQDVSDQVEAFTRQRENAESRNRLIKELEIRSQQMALLNEMSNLLECCATTDEAGAVVIQSVQRFFPDAISGTLYVFKSSRNLVETAAKWGKTSPSEALFPPESCWGLRRGQAHWNDDSSEGVRCSHLTESKFAESVCVPLVGQRETLGILFLEFGVASSPGLSPLPVTQDDLRVARQTLAATVASQIALSLANLRLRETLRDQSIRDPLTSLFNRRFMQESLDREIHRAQRRHQSLSVMILDLDHFKRFNDAFGHDAGDFVLRSLADVFRKFFRAEDVVCRQGGEEFVFILPEASSQEALERANALRDEVGKLGLKYDNKLLGAVTLSLGVATYPEHSLETEELLKIADQCLYQSKAKGRDMVTVASAQAITAHA
jgi:diguanylate cyclase (GGDEF)-like protein/PAS domain S-box-containing protein